MPWNALLIDGPLEHQTVHVDEEDVGDPPPVLTLGSYQYVYCGFSNDTPRYRFDGESAGD